MKFGLILKKSLRFSLKITSAILATVMMWQTAAAPSVGFALILGDQQVLGISSEISFFDNLFWRPDINPMPTAFGNTA